MEGLLHQDQDAAAPEARGRFDEGPAVKYHLCADVEVGRWITVRVFGCNCSSACLRSATRRPAPLTAVPTAGRCKSNNRPALVTRPRRAFLFGRTPRDSNGPAWAARSRTPACTQSRRHARRGATPIRPRPRLYTRLGGESRVQRRDTGFYKADARCPLG